MSWVLGGSPATLEELVDVRPGLRGDFDRINTELWSGGAVPPAVLELVRLRVATLLACDAELAGRTAAAGVSEDRIRRLSRWPEDPSFDARDRACLAFAEQFVLDAKGVTDADIDAVRGQLGDEGAVALAVAVALFEGQARASVALGATAGRR